MLSFSYCVAPSMVCRFESKHSTFANLFICPHGSRQRWTNPYHEIESKRCDGWRQIPHNRCSHLFIESIRKVTNVEIMCGHTICTNCRRFHSSMIPLRHVSRKFVFFASIRFYNFLIYGFGFVVRLMRCGGGYESMASTQFAVWI